MQQVYGHSGVNFTHNSLEVFGGKRNNAKKPKIRIHIDIFAAYNETRNLFNYIVGTLCTGGQVGNKTHECNFGMIVLRTK